MPFKNRTLKSGFQMVLDKMAAKMSGFQMLSLCKNVRFSNVSGIQMSGFRILTVDGSLSDPVIVLG